MNIDAVTKAVQSVTGGPCLLHRPHLNADDDHAVLDVLGRGDLVQADVIAAFEAKLAEVTGRRYAVATLTGTMALRTSLDVLAIHTVAMPTLTYCATLAAKPINHYSFYDNLEPVSPVRDALVTVDLFGLPCADVELASNVWISDACESLGTTGTWDSRMLAACYSFNANKIVTCGQGGAIVTDDEGWADTVRQYLNQGRVKGSLTPEFIGTNGRMSPMCAALGLSQLDRFDDILAAHREVHDRYLEALAGIDEIRVVRAPAGVSWNHWLTVVQVDDAADRDPLLSALHALGIEARACFPCLHKHGPWRDESLSFPAAEDFSARTLLLPSGAL